MEMRVFFYWFFVSCFVIARVPTSEGKTVSLNELIAAESRRVKATEKPGNKSAELNHSPAPYSSSSREHHRDTQPARTSNKGVKNIKVKDNQAKKKPTGLLKKLTVSPAKRVLDKKALLRGTNGPNKFKGLLSDLESEASDIINVLRRKVSTQKHSGEAKSSGKLEDGERLSLNKLLFRDPRKPRELQITELITPRGKKLLSSLKYRKKFHIKSPLKAKKVRRQQKPRYKRKNQSVKRHVNYGRFDRQYVPLLRSLSMLFDNVLGSGSEETDKESRDGEEQMDMASSNIVRNVSKRNQTNNKQASKLPYFRNRTTYRSRNETDDKSREDNRSSEDARRHKDFGNVKNATITEIIGNDEGNGSKKNNSKERTDGRSNNVEDKEQKERSCSCASKTGSETEESKTREEAITTTAVPEVSNETIQVEAASTTTDHPSIGNVSSIRSDTNVSLLPPGNTTGTGRNLTGLSEGSGPTFHGGVEGNISRDHRDSEHNSRSGEDKSDATDDEENPDSVARNGTNSGQSGGRVRGDSDEIRGPVYRGDSYEVQETQVIEEIDTEPGRIIQEAQVVEEIIAGPSGRVGFQEEDNVKDGRNEAEGATTLQQSVRQLGGRVSEDRVGNNTELLQSKEDHEESFNSVHKPLPSDKRLTVRNGSSPSEAEETGAADETTIDSSEDETTITLEDLADPMRMLRATPKRKAPYVTIIDGYSVARDINGKNKLSEHSIRFHS